MKKTILYIEDDRFNMTLIKKMLRIMGYEMVAAFDGSSGLVAARFEQPSLILMDINLPDMSGLEVTRLLKADPMLRYIPIVALTADITNQYACLSAGCDGYLNKPISRAALLRTVKQFTEDVGLNV